MSCGVWEMLQELEGTKLQEKIMLNLFVFASIMIFVAVIFAIVRRSFASVKEKAKYRYARKNFFLTRAEHECYDALVEAVGSEYRIFAQVHLPMLVESKVVGQNWRGAFRHISEKSVDFVLCDTAYISPRLAIELDDKSHERPERQERDHEVERIFRGAGIPLLRVGNHGRFSSSDLSQQIAEALKE